MTKTLPFSIRMNPELKAYLQKLADDDRRTLTNYVEIVLSDHAVAKGMKRPGKDKR